MHYDAYYFRHGCGRPYQRDDEWLRFFAAIAERIHLDIAPATVLDGGCAMGFLVESLRNFGIAAFGMDISEYALGCVKPEIKPYCMKASILEPLSSTYDLVILIEVLEHLTPDEGWAALKNICAHTEDILFSSSPFDYKEATHVNTQPPEYWAKLFSRLGFYRDVDYDATFITSWAVRYRKSQGDLSQVLSGYERRFWHYYQEIHARRALGIEQRNELADKEARLIQLETQLAHLNEAHRREETDHAQQLALQAAAHLNELNALRNELSALHQHDLAALRGELHEARHEKQLLLELLHAHERRISAITSRPGWLFIDRFGEKRLALIPRGSRRERLWYKCIRFFRSILDRGFFTTVFKSGQALVRGSASSINGGISPSNIPNADNQPPAFHQGHSTPPPVLPRKPLGSHAVAVDIIICVHNALEDFRMCLDSVLLRSNHPYTLIVIDDGSDPETRAFIKAQSQIHGFFADRNETAKGYTRAANQGLRYSSGDFVVFLNSDTIVTAGWLDRMVACAESNPKIGLVGPLSNTASWQSIPEIELEGDWASNPLPDGMTVEQMGNMVARYSARLYPQIAFLNGFCLLIKRQVINEIGCFDEEAFGAGFGEEDDYTLRCRKSGWLLALADDTYIYHSQSKSYSNERRLSLVQVAGQALRKKHGDQIIIDGVSSCRTDRVLEGLRSRSRTITQRHEFIRTGTRRFADRKILFVLPIQDPGGGGNVIVTEARCMQQMRVDVHFFNLKRYQSSFTQAYPELDIPVRYGEIEDIAIIASEYDAVIATHHDTVGWISPIRKAGNRPVVGYYIQGFEPLMYPEGSDGYSSALNSYGLIKDIIPFCKTLWTQQQVLQNTGVQCRVIGISVDVDLFCPRPRTARNAADRKVRVAAMIRPNSPYRSPHMTMEILRQIQLTCRERVEILLFGADPSDIGFRELPQAFTWTLAGVIDSARVATLLNEADIFADLSLHQAMGLTALEAMACGAAVVAPVNGGSTEFAFHERNSLIVNTESPDACLLAIKRLIDDDSLRLSLQRRAMEDACQYFPEKSAYGILNALFPGVIDR